MGYSAVSLTEVNTNINPLSLYAPRVISLQKAFWSVRNASQIHADNSKSLSCPLYV